MIKSFWKVFTSVLNLVWITITVCLWATLVVIFSLLPVKPVDRIANGLAGVGTWVSIWGRKALGLLALLVGFVWATIKAAWCWPNKNENEDWDI